MYLKTLRWINYLGLLAWPDVTRVLKLKVGSKERAQEVKLFATNPDDSSSITGTSISTKATLILKSLFICIGDLSLSVPHACLVPRGPKTGVRDVCELPYEC